MAWQTSSTLLDAGRTTSNRRRYAKFLLELSGHTCDDGSSVVMTYAGVANPVVPSVTPLVTYIVRLTVTQMVTHAAVLTSLLQEVYIYDPTGLTCVICNESIDACIRMRE